MLLRQAPNCCSEGPGSRIPCLVPQPHCAVLLIQLRLVSRFFWPLRSRWRRRRSSPAPLLAARNTAIRLCGQQVPTPALRLRRAESDSSAPLDAHHGARGHWQVAPGEAPSPTLYRLATQFPSGSSFRMEASLPQGRFRGADRLACLIRDTSQPPSRVLTLPGRGAGWEAAPPSAKREDCPEVPRGRMRRGWNWSAAATLSDGPRSIPAPRWRREGGDGGRKSEIRWGEGRRPGWAAGPWRAPRRRGCR